MPSVTLAAAFDARDATVGDAIETTRAVAFASSTLCDDEAAVEREGGDKGPMDSEPFGRGVLKPAVADAAEDGAADDCDVPRAATPLLPPPPTRTTAAASIVACAASAFFIRAFSSS